MKRDESATRRQQVDETRSELELTRRMAESAARAAAGMFARDVTIIDLTDVVSYTDYFVVASAETERQTRRIVEEVLDKMRDEGYRPRSRRVDEGTAWISLDFLDVVVHIFTDEARDYYRLESLWRGAPQERWED
ncbi:MAG: ribosome silencing factor [Actinomycetota bacterium]|nr:ribosome silencing factor [Actinomycetota bacterium]